MSESRVHCANKQVEKVTQERARDKGRRGAEGMHMTLDEIGFRNKLGTTVDRVRRGYENGLELGRIW